ncbi:MAG: hypothetical protein ACK5YO_32940, partial [Planctomyces sp.]
MRGGLYAFNGGAGEYRVLELANVDWVREGGRRALRFSENPRERADYPPLGLLDTWLNVNDRVSSDSTVEAGRWSHVAMTCEPVVGSGECGC